jgi:hypothetical protein
MFALYVCDSTLPSRALFGAVLSLAACYQLLSLILLPIHSVDVVARESIAVLGASVVGAVTYYQLRGVGRTVATATV